MPALLRLKKLRIQNGHVEISEVNVLRCQDDSTRWKSCKGKNVDSIVHLFAFVHRSSRFVIDLFFYLSKGGAEKRNSPLFKGELTTGWRGREAISGVSEMPDMVKKRRGVF